MAVININRNQFEEMVHSGKAVLVEFSAPWCVYCRRLAPALESISVEFDDHDKTCDHLLLTVDGTPAATARVFMKDEQTAKIGRLAVLKLSLIHI